jgi:hypothetical protein
MVSYRSLHSSTNLCPLIKGLNEPIPPLSISKYKDCTLISFDQLPPNQVELLCRLRNSTILISSIHARASSSTSTRHFSKSSVEEATKLENNEQYILKARLSEEFALQSHLPPSNKCTAWLIAAVLYSSKVLSFSLAVDPAEYHVVEKLVDALQTALLQEHNCPFGELDGYAPNLLLWILLVGGASADSFGMDQTKWFGTAAIELCRLIGLQQWKGVKETLRDFPRSDSFTETPCRTFWERSRDGLK